MESRISLKKGSPNDKTSYCKKGKHLKADAGSFLKTVLQVSMVSRAESKRQDFKDLNRFH